MNYQPMIQLPLSDVRLRDGDEKRSRYCLYHREMGHGTGFCTELWDLSEERNQSGELLL